MPLGTGKSAVTAMFAINMALEAVTFEFGKPAHVFMLVAVGYGVNGVSAIRPRTLYFDDPRDFIFFRKSQCLFQRGGYHYLLYKDNKKTSELVALPHFSTRAPARIFTPTPIMRPHGESNLDLSLRRAALYPLSYGDFLI